MTDCGSEGPFARGDVLLDQYEVSRLLGIGGHAYVYECRDLFLDELLAVKIIPNPPNRGRELLDRARAEAQLLRRLSHPNVVRMHTAAALRDDMVCLVMEKLDGISLRHLLALLTRLSVAEALSIVRQVAVGVGAAHQLDVVHRDIKPDNVFVLPPNNHVKVLDFGIAKFLSHGLQTSNKYRFQGTPLYMSPEHLRGVGVTVRSDVYQLGTVLFELIAGVNPSLIDLDNPGFDQVAFVQITRPTPSLLRFSDDTPEYVDRLVQCATAKDPGQRFGSMQEFVESIDQALNEYVRTHPDAPLRIRYVDATLMKAAKNLAALEAAYSSGPSTVPFDGPPPSGSTEPIDTVRDRPRTLSDTEQTEKVVSYHPIPEIAGSSLSPSVRPSSPGDVPNPRRENRSKPSRSLSTAFVLFAIGFGAIGGSAALWFLLWHVDRSKANQPAATAAVAASPPASSAPQSQVPVASAASSYALAAPAPVAVLPRAAKALPDSVTPQEVAPAAAALPPAVSSIATPPLGVSASPTVDAPAPNAPTVGVSAAPTAAPLSSQNIDSVAAPRGRRLITGRVNSDATN